MRVISAGACGPQLTVLHVRVDVIARMLLRRVIVRVVGVERVLDVLGRGPARLAPEGQEHQPPAVEARQQRREDADREGDAAVRRAAGERALDDRVLGIETGEPEDADDANPRYRQRAREHRVEGQRDRFPQAPVEAHVLFVVHSVDHRPRAQEQQRLEESVREEVEHRGRVSAHPRRHEHVAQLRTG